MKIKILRRHIFYRMKSLRWKLCLLSVPRRIPHKWECFINKLRKIIRLKESKKSALKYIWNSNLLFNNNMIILNLKVISKSLQAIVTLTRKTFLKRLMGIIKAQISSWSNHLLAVRHPLEILVGILSIFTVTKLKLIKLWASK